MEILDMAKQLGEAISTSNEMKEYNDCEAIVNTDQKAIDLMKDIEQIRNDFVKGSQENAPEGELDVLREQYMQKQQEFETYPVTVRFMEAKNTLDALMQNVNNTIIFGMTGEMPCSKDGCSSCGGGCK